MRNSLGIYFGFKIITIVEANGRNILSNTQILRSTFLGDELEAKVPDEVKMVAFFKDEFRKSRIQAKEMSLGLSGKDLIIRSFELPQMPSAELANAVNYEAKKYIPFKLEDLVSSFQVHFDKVNRKNLVLFVGVKTETRDKYLSIFNELNIKINAIEYSVFSLLRFLQLTDFAKFGNKGITSVISMDFQEESEVNFLVLENGFPLFSRDITLLGRPDDSGQSDSAEIGDVIEKLKTEIRISLDYYDRKFPSKNIEKMFILTGDTYRSELETLVKDIGLSVKFIEAMRYIGKPMPFSMSFIKGYGSSLTKSVKIIPKIDLLGIQPKTKASLESATLKTKGSFFADLRLNVDLRIVALCVLLCAGTFGFGLYHIRPLEKELSALRSTAPSIASINPNASLTELSNLVAEYKKKMTDMDSLIKRRLYLTPQLQVIPEVIPDGMWLTNFSFSKREDKLQFTLTGTVFLGDSDKEFSAVNKLAGDLKVNPVFSRYFSDINVVSITHGEFEKSPTTNFVILCQ